MRVFYQAWNNLDAICSLLTSKFEKTDDQTVRQSRVEAFLSVSFSSL